MVCSVLKMFEQEKFDIVITDINMPLMDGLKLIGKIRRGTHNERVPIIVITTENAPADRAKALKLGANAYIIKPIQVHRVVEAMRLLLGV